MTHEVHHVAAEDLLDLLEPESVDLFLTDPPRKTEPNRWFWIFAGMLRALKPSGRILMMVDENTMDRIKQALLVRDPTSQICRGTQLLNLVYWDALVWDCNEDARNHRFIMIFEKIPAQYPYEATPSILAYIPKLELAKSLVKFASTEGDLIVDPFCGSGEFGEAAQTLGRDYIGGDISEKAVTLTKGRL